MFDINQRVADEDGDWDEELTADYCDGLMEVFAVSPEGSAAAERYRGLGWAYSFLDFGLSYLGLRPPEMSRGDVEEILFDLFPRKVSTEPERAGEIIGEIRAFWEFLRRQYALPNATAILDDLGDDASDQLEQELADPGNFGMAKSFVMMGDRAGFDMTTQEGIEQFMLAFNARELGAIHPEMSAIPPPVFSPPPPKFEVPRPSAAQRKEREKLRRKKLDTSKRRRKKRR